MERADRHDVFISYSSRDKPVADAACAILEARGIRCWIAPRDVVPGQDWSEAIIDAITACRVFLLLLSEASNQSEQVKREVQNAVSEAKSILPVRIEEVTLSKHMRYFIGTPHWLDALSRPLERHLHRMADTVAAWLVSLAHGDPESMTLPADSPPATSETARWKPEYLARLETELRGLIGPLAPALVRQAAAGARDEGDLCRRLADHVPSDGERQAFLARVAQPDSPAGTPTATLSPEAVAAGAKALAAYIGPLAHMLARRASGKALDLDEFHRILAEQLSSPAEKDGFLRRVRGQ